MNKENQFDKKRKLKQQQQNDDDDEQIEKTLNFLDSILDQYLTDQDIIDEKNYQKVSPQVKPINVTSSSSLSPHYIRVPQVHHRSEQTHQVRRYTSETNLNQIPSSSKPKSSHSRLLQTTATSTEDLSTIPSQTSRSNFIKNINHPISNGASASLIDLTSVDKSSSSSSSRPRFRFVPSSSNENLIIKEEPEIEQRSNSKYDQFHMKTISSDQKTSFNNQNKSSHKIVKPTVIIPSVPKSAPINRLIETNIHHQNGHSAFKPHRSSQNGVSSKIQQIKRTESIQKSNVHVGITNSHNQLPHNGLLLRQQQSMPQLHQSMVNFPSTELVNANRIGSHTSYQSNVNHPSRPIIHDDPISRRIQQVHNTSSINGLVHPEENRSHQQTHPYGSYISTSTGFSPIMNSHRQPTYFNPINKHKHPIPVQPVYIASPPATRNGVYPSSSSNVYNFNQNNSPRTEQSRRTSHRQNATITTYL